MTRHQVSSGGPIEIWAAVLVSECRLLNVVVGACGVVEEPAMAVVVSLQGRSTGLTVAGH